jgi:hypothetical protein
MNWLKVLIWPMFWIGLVIFPSALLMSTGILILLAKMQSSVGCKFLPPTTGACRYAIEKRLQTVNEAANCLPMVRLGLAHSDVGARRGAFHSSSARLPILLTLKPEMRNQQRGAARDLAGPVSLAAARRPCAGSIWVLMADSSDPPSCAYARIAA